MTIKILAALLIALALTGCGQSGPLYVPGDPSSVEQMPASATSDENGEEDGEEDEG